MENDWAGDDEAFDLALKDEALEQLLDAPKPSAECDGFDESSGNNWLYPSNLPLRSYQHSIVQAALYRNTLVVLPTGLGKTFIAAVVMYNLHRWYPESKLIFMAPTRPLVSQQIAACQKIMPFSADDMVELTGRLPRAKRAELWQSKRVFFATPQVVQSDMLDTGDGAVRFPYMSIKLLVVDEAHRAKGRFAYTQVTESLMARNPHFRMLALSATPGRTMEDVAAVCRNLYISHLEVRWDDSFDVRQYIHKRSMRTVVVPLRDRIREPRTRLLEIIDPYLRQLIAANVLKGARGNITRNNLLFDQTRFQEHSARGQRHPDHNAIVSNFAMCISLYHALELLERHGLRVFVNNFDADERGRLKFVLKDLALRELLEHVRQQLGDNPLDYSTHAMTNGKVAPLPTNLDFGHPKYEEARQVLLQHFESHKDSRAIVFCEYRESVMLIQRLLLQHRPLLRPRCFVGQSAAGSGICALTQKEQVQIMSDFREGVSNVLVATSIGEEGLDVGEVELIVCFDISSSNPTRFVQRIGRTGRQKQGAVVMLVTEGREEQLLKEVLAHKDQTNRKLLQSTLIKGALYQHAPRLVPPQFHPRCEQRFMESAPPSKPQTPSPSSKGRKPKAAKQSVKCQDLRKFFKQSQERFLKDEPAYSASEASQLQLQAQAARQSVPIKNFLLDTQDATAPAPAPAPASQEETLRLRRLTRLLQSTKPLLSETQRGQDLLAQLQDKQLPPTLKLFLLECNADFVRETHAKMLEQLQRQLPEQRLNSRQQRTRRIYELMQQLCGDHLERLLQPAACAAELTLQDLRQPQREESFQAACGQIFAGLQERGLCADNHELVQQQWEQLELRQLEQTMREQLGNDITGMYEGWQDEDELDVEESFQLPQADASNCPSSTPLRVRKLPMENEPRLETELETSHLSASLSRLNCLVRAASTPIQEKQKETSQLAEKSLLDILNEDWSTLEQLVEEQKVEREMAPKVPVTPEELELDLEDFLEPLPEEQQLQLQRQQSAETTPRNLSPDLFAEDSMSPWKPTPTPAVAPQSLAAKLAAKPTVAQSPQRPNVPVVQERSPSIFENYLRSMRGRGQLSREAQRIHTMTSSAAATTTAAVAAPVEDEDSPIVRRRSAKRKICDTFDEDDEDEEQLLVQATQIMGDDSYEQVPATQMPELVTPPRKLRGKRAKFNPFVLQEAEQSGSDHDEDEDAERTIGAYLKDSVIVSSEDEGHNDTTTHAMYLQGIRSPIHRPGAFKMPAPRAYHDEFSQLVEAEPSQYFPSSFVVNDESTANETHDTTECPLERAERILKEQRRQRRRGIQQVEQVQQSLAGGIKRRRIQTISDSSDDDDVVLVK